MGNATNVKFGRYTQRVHPNKSQLKIWEKMERGRIQGLPPIISRRGKATNFKLIRYIHRVHANKSPLKVWENRERGRIQDSRDSQIFEVLPIISGMGKATNVKFGRYIHRVNPNKSPLNFWEKMERGVSRDCPNFLSALYYLMNG